MASIQDLEFRPYEAGSDRELVEGFLLETLSIGSDEEVDSKETIGPYFEAVGRAQGRDPRFCSLALMDGHVVGLLDEFPMPVRPESAFMRFLYVVPELRGSGVAERIVEYGDRLVGDLGCREVLLDVREGNGRAVGFYRRLGWEVLEQREGGFQRMRRKL